MSNQEPQPIDWQAIGKQLQEGMNQFVASLQPAIQSVATIAKSISEAMHTAYLEDGAIYGESQEGLLRWIDEKGKINRLRMEAEYLEQDHEEMRVLRLRLAEKREEQA